MRVGYLGPEGTFSQEALVASGFARESELVPLMTIRETVSAAIAAVTTVAPRSTAAGSARCALGRAKPSLRHYRCI